MNFVPRESGVHYVHLTLNGNHVPGSPYPVQVGQLDADASRVRAYGDGLHKGQTGKMVAKVLFVDQKIILLRNTPQIYQPRQQRMSYAAIIY